MDVKVFLHQLCASSPSLKNHPGFGQGKFPICGCTLYVVSKNYMGCHGCLSKFSFLPVPPGMQVMPGLGFELRRELLC